MAINFITADQRLARKPKVTLALLGPAGAGKTFQARTLPPAETLFVSLEAGDLALGNWGGTVIDARAEAARLGVHPWVFCRALACLLAGPDPAASPDPTKVSSWYGSAAFAQYEANICPAADLAQFSIIYWDSITVAGRWSFAWAQMQPDAVSEKSGKYDGRGAYGRHGQEMVTWLTQIQHCPKSTIVSGILEQDTDDFGRTTWSPQIDGGKTGRELPGIFDQVVTIGRFNIGTDGAPVCDMQAGEHRAFVCSQINPYGLPAKGRDGCLATLEPPNLGALLQKIAAGQRIDSPVLTMPTAA